MDRRQCSDAWDGHITETMFCAGGGIFDSCDGDSGSSIIADGGRYVPIAHDKYNRLSALSRCYHPLRAAPRPSPLGLSSRITLARLCRPPALSHASLACVLYPSPGWHGAPSSPLSFRILSTPVAFALPSTGYTSTGYTSDCRG